MSDVTNSARVNVYINGQSGIAEIEKLERKMIKLGKEVNRVGKDSELGRKLQAEMRLAQGEVDKLAKKINLSTMSIKQLSSEATRLRRLRDMAQPGTQEFVRLNRELKAVNDRMRVVQTGLGSFGQAWKMVWDQMKGFNLALVGIFAGNLIFTWFKDVIRGASDLSDQMADIQKTTGMTKREVRELNKEFSQLDTRTPTKDLREMAIVAGQLGIAKEDIAAFVKSVDTANVALGDEFTGGASQVAEELGKLRNIFTDLKSERVDQDLLRIGNAFNVLAAEGAATGPVMSENSNRIGGYGIQVGLTTGQVIGLAAAQQELNIASERGSTAIIRILQKMLQEVETFSEVAGLPVAEFKKMLDTDLFGAFMKVVEGSRKVGNSNTKLAAIIDELEVSGAGASEVFAKFGANVELVKQKADLATKSLGGTQSIMDEFRLKNENAAAAAEKIGKAISGWFTRKFVEPAERFLVWLGKATGLITSMTEKLQAERTELVLTEMKLKDVNLKQEDRVKLIQELQNKYPQYLGNLDAETVKNDELFRAIQKTNKELVNRIIISKRQEEIDKQSEEIAKKLERRLELEDQLATRIAKLVQENSKLKIPEGDLQTQATSILAQLEAAGQKNYSLFSDYMRITRALRDYQDVLALENAETEKGNKLIQARAELLKRLGIEEEKSSPSEQVVAPVAATGQIAFDFSKDEKKEKKKKEPFKFDLSKLGEYKQQIEQFYNDVSLLYATDREIAINEATRKYDSLLDKNWHLQQELLAAIWTGDKKERAAAQKQLAALMRDEEAIYAQRAEAAGRAEAEINRKRAEARLDAEKQIKAALLTPQQAEIAQALEHYNLLIELAKQYGIDYTKLVEAREKAVKEITEKHQKETEKAQQERNQRIVDTVGRYTTEAINIINPIVQSINNFAERQILESDRVAQQRMANLDKARDRGLITEQQYQDKKLALEKKQAKEIGAIKRKQAIADRIAATASVVFNTAQAIMEAVAMSPTTGGLPWSAIAAVVGAAQTTAIWSAPMPQYRKGLAGIPGGPSHENGGLDIVNSQTGRKVAEMEGGEPYMILSTSTYANNGALIDKLIRASLYEGGRRLSADEIISAAPSIRMPSKSAVSSGMFRDGGVMRSPKRRSSMTSEMRQFIAAVQSFTEAVSKPVRAELVYRDLRETEEEESRIRSLANIGSSKARPVATRSSSTTQTVIVNQGGSTEPGPAGPPGADGTGLELYMFNNS